MLEENQQLVTDDDSKQTTSKISMSPQQPTDAPAPVIAASTSASHQPPVFNILVAGQPRIGKTGLLRLLLDTSCLSNTSSLPRIACLAEFASYAGTCPTTSISCATADIPAIDQRPEFVLNLVDSPGLLFHDPQELEKGVNLLLRQITDSFDASQAVPVSGEYRPSEVRLKPFSRHRNGRTNICTYNNPPQSCLYLLEPDDIIPSFTRHPRRPDRYGVPTKLPRNRVHLAAIRSSRGGSGSKRPAIPGDTPTPESQHYDDDPEDEWGRASIPKAELRVIRRLAEYITVLPVIAKADTLTDERLDTVKRAVHRDLSEAGLSFAPFDRQTVSSGGSRTTPPPSPLPMVLPYAIMIPDKYHHGDGVPRSGTKARPMLQQYMAQYRAAQVTAQDASSSGGLRPTQPGEFIRTYRWGAVDVLNPVNSDFTVMRESILTLQMETLRTLSLSKYFEKYKRDLLRAPATNTPMSEPPPESRFEQARYPQGSPRLVQQPQQSPYLPSASPTISHHPSYPAHPYVDPHSLRAGSHQVTPVDYPQHRYRGQTFSNPALPPIAPSGMSHPSSSQVAESSNSMRSQAEDPHFRSTGLNPAQPPKHRTGRKIAVACNFCRSRKLKCDGGKPQCQQCMRRTVDCEYEVSVKRRGLGKTTAAVLAQKGDATTGDVRATSTPGDSNEGRGSAQVKTVACQFCRARKTRCDGLQPRCSNCEKRNVECVYAYQASSPPEETSQVSPATTRLPPVSSFGPAPTRMLPSPSLPPIQTLPEDKNLPSMPRTNPMNWPPRPHVPISPTDPLPSTSAKGMLGPSETTVTPHDIEGDPGRPRSLFHHSASGPFGSFVPEPTRSTPADTHSWQDRSSFSSSSTRGGGMPATPTTPRLKRKAEIYDKEMILGILGSSSSSPPKKRRISGPDDDSDHLPIVEAEGLRRQERDIYHQGRARELPRPVTITSPRRESGLLHKTRTDEVDSPPTKGHGAEFHG